MMGKAAEQTGGKSVLWNSPYRISPNKTHRPTVLIFLSLCIITKDLLIIFSVHFGSIWIQFMNTKFLIWIPPFDKVGKNPSKPTWLTVGLIDRDLTFNTNNSNSPERYIPWNYSLSFYLVSSTELHVLLKITLQINIFDYSSKEIDVLKSQWKTQTLF